MTFNPDLARERIRFLRARIWDVTRGPRYQSLMPFYEEIDWWNARLAEHLNA